MKFPHFCTTVDIDRVSKNESMETTEKIVKEKEVVHEDGHKKEYASKGLAGTALGLGIGGLALALWNRNGGGLPLLGGGGGTPENVNINTLSAMQPGSAPTAFQAWEKECDDALALTNELWAMRVATMAEMYQHRNVDVNEKFQLWKSQVDGDFGNYKAIRDLYDVSNDKLNNAAFGLYKSQRDGFDALSARICDLEKQVAVGAAIRPYQDALIKCEIEKAYNAGINYTDRRCCRMITGQVVLPNTPAVTGYGSYCCCQPATQAAG